MRERYDKLEEFCSEFKLTDLPPSPELFFNKAWEVVRELEGSFPHTNMLLSFLRERSPNPEEAQAVEKRVNELRREFSSTMNELREVLERLERRWSSLGIYRHKDVLSEVRPQLVKAVGLLNAMKREICGLIGIFELWSDVKIEQAKYTPIMGGFRQ